MQCYFAEPISFCFSESSLSLLVVLTGRHSAPSFPVFPPLSSPLPLPTVPLHVPHPCSLQPTGEWWLHAAARFLWSHSRWYYTFVFSPPTLQSLTSCQRWTSLASHFKCHVCAHCHGDTVSTAAVSSSTLVGAGHLWKLTCNCSSRLFCLDE